MFEWLLTRKVAASLDSKQFDIRSETGSLVKVSRSEVSYYRAALAARRATVELKLSDGGSDPGVGPSSALQDGCHRVATPGVLSPDEQRIMNAMSVDAAREEHLQRHNGGADSHRELSERIPHVDLGRYEQVRGAPAILSHLEAPRSCRVSCTLLSLSRCTRGLHETAEHPAVTSAASRVC